MTYPLWPVRSFPASGVGSAVAVVLGMAAAGAAEERPRVTIPKDAVRHEIGHCYIASMDFGEDGDKETRNKLMLVLCENGKPLGPAKSLHADIRNKGGGRYRLAAPAPVQ